MGAPVYDERRGESELDTLRRKACTMRARIAALEQRLDALSSGIARSRLVGSP